MSTWLLPAVPQWHSHTQTQTQTHSYTLCMLLYVCLYLNTLMVMIPFGRCSWLLYEATFSFIDAVWITCWKWLSSLWYSIDALPLMIMRTTMLFFLSFILLIIKNGNGTTMKHQYHHHHFVYHNHVYIYTFREYVL